MASLGVALPLELDSMDGFVMLKNIKPTIKARIIIYISKVKIENKFLIRL